MKVYNKEVSHTEVMVEIDGKEYRKQAVRRAIDAMRGAGDWFGYCTYGSPLEGLYAHLHALGVLIVRPDQYVAPGPNHAPFLAEFEAALSSLQQSESHE